VCRQTATPPTVFSDSHETWHIDVCANMQKKCGTVFRNFDFKIFGEFFQQWICLGRQASLVLTSCVFLKKQCFLYFSNYIVIAIRHSRRVHLCGDTGA